MPIAKAKLCGRQGPAVAGARGKPPRRRHRRGDQREPRTPLRLVAYWYGLSASEAPWSAAQASAAARRCRSWRGRARGRPRSRSGSRSRRRGRRPPGRSRTGQVTPQWELPLQSSPGPTHRMSQPSGRVRPCLAASSRFSLQAPSLTSSGSPAALVTSPSAGLSRLRLGLRLVRGLRGLRLVCVAAAEARVTRVLRRAGLGGHPCRPSGGRWRGRRRPESRTGSPRRR